MRVRQLSRENLGVVERVQRIVSMSDDERRLIERAALGRRRRDPAGE
jgi:hypothetical protein